MNGARLRPGDQRPDFDVVERHFAIPDEEEKTISVCSMPVDQGAAIAHANVHQVVFHDQVDGECLIQPRNLVHGRSITVLHALVGWVETQFATTFIIPFATSTQAEVQGSCPGLGAKCYPHILWNIGQHGRGQTILGDKAILHPPARRPQTSPGGAR